MSSDCQTEVVPVLPQHHSVIIGVVRSSSQLELLNDALFTLGVEAEVLPWLECALLMEDGVDPNCHRVFGQMEHATCQRYLDLMMDGQIVFGVEVEPEDAGQVANMVFAFGAHEVVHYLGWIVTSYDAPR